MKSFPVLVSGQVCVIRAEVDTGYVLGRTGQRCLGDEDPYRVFETVEEAREYARTAVSLEPAVECVLLRGADDVIEVLRDEDYVRTRVAEARKKRSRRWWQFWR